MKKAKVKSVPSFQMNMKSAAQEVRKRPRGSHPDVHRLLFHTARALASSAVVCLLV